MNDLEALVGEHLGKAKADPHGRSAHLILHDGPLRQTVIALTAGSAIDERNTPVAASLQVLRGTIRFGTPSEERELTAGQILAVPHEEYGLTARAVDDAVVLLTAVTET